MTPLELYSKRKRSQDELANIFEENYVLINDISCSSTHASYSFLKKIKSKPKTYFIYCVCDTKNRIVKFGKSITPFKRILEHVNNFVCYGGANIDDLYCIWSRELFHEDSKIETELLNEFRYHNENCPQVGQEFFVSINPINIENFFCNFVNKISYRSYE